MYDFQKDLEAWERYAIRAHSRRFVKQDFYVGSQSLVETKGHQLIAAADCDRSRILEIGTGGGEHIAFERPDALENYFAADIKPQFLSLVKQQFPRVTTVLLDGTSLPFEDGFFTTCIASAVLEHVSALDATLIEIDRVLAPNGSLLVVVPTNGSLCINLFKLLVTYPTLRANGIARPSYIWHFENVNSMARIRALLWKNFDITTHQSVPLRFLPAALSPLYFFHCRKRAN